MGRLQQRSKAEVAALGLPSYLWHERSQGPSAAAAGGTIDLASVPAAQRFGWPADLAAAASAAPAAVLGRNGADKATEPASSTHVRACDYTTSHCERSTRPHTKACVQAGHAGALELKEESPRHRCPSSHSQEGCCVHVPQPPQPRGYNQNPSQGTGKVGLGGWGPAPLAPPWHQLAAPNGGRGVIMPAAALEAAAPWHGRPACARACRPGCQCR